MRLKTVYRNHDDVRDKVADKLMDVKMYLDRLWQCKKSISEADRKRIELIIAELTTLSDNIREGV